MKMRMAGNKFEAIYTALKAEITEGVFNDTMLLPTEKLLAERFGTSRNTIRRAIQLLNDEGLVYSVKGRGVVILESTRIDQKFFRIGNFQGLKAMSSAKNVKIQTRVQDFQELTVDEALSSLISFPVGERVYYVRRVRVVNDRAMAYDTSYFKKSIVRNLSENIVKASIYDYIEQTLDFKIAASKVVLEVISATSKDFELLDLSTNNCVGKLVNMVYTDMGRLFEHTTVNYIPNEYALVTFEQKKN